MTNRSKNRPQDGSKSDLKSGSSGIPGKVTLETLYKQQEKENRRLKSLVIVAWTWTVILLIIPVLLLCFAFIKVEEISKYAKDLEKKIDKETTTLFDELKTDFDQHSQETIRREIESALEKE